MSKERRKWRNDREADVGLVALIHEKITWKYLGML